MKQSPISFFANHICRRPLYPYQEVIAEAILASVLHRRGLTFSVMLARQMGKNQLSAIIESYLLFAFQEGTMIKAAPTFTPQIITSRLRLLSMLEAPLLRSRFWKSLGYIIGLAPSPGLVRAQSGPRIMFFSASPDASIVGATASLLLEIDEAQDVDPHKYDVELKPMASTTNATTVMYGTAWSDDTLLARQRAYNLQREQEDGIKRHFEYDWRTLAALNPQYQRFVEDEIARLGEDHVSIRTQYRLLPISGAGHLLNDMQLYLLSGGHHWEEEPEESSIYLLGIDIGGEERRKAPAEGMRSHQRDSTIITIGKVCSHEFDLPRLEIVHQACFNGMQHRDQYAAMCAIVQRWNARRVVIDATGLGEMLASLLIDKFGPERITAFKFSRASKSHLTYQLLSMINAARLKLYSQEQAPSEIYRECWQQLKLARYQALGEHLIGMSVAPEEGHDDFLISLALCCEAVREFATPVQEAIIIKPPPLYGRGGF